MTVNLEILNLSNEARAQFVNALLNPPEPNAAARAAAARYIETALIAARAILTLLEGSQDPNADDMRGCAQDIIAALESE